MLLNTNRSFKTLFQWLDRAGLWELELGPAAASLEKRLSVSCQSQWVERGTWAVPSLTTTALNRNESSFISARKTTVGEVVGVYVKAEHPYGNRSL